MRSGVRERRISTKEFKTIQGVTDTLPRQSGYTRKVDSLHIMVARNSFTQETVHALDKIMDKLNHHSKAVYHPAIQVSMKNAAKKLDQYYGLTDSSSTYRIAMGEFVVNTQCFY
jgi:hypothetical protein